MKFDISRVEKYQFTKTEMEVVSRIFEGMTNKEIGDSLYISVGGVKWHMDHIYRKMKVGTREKCIVTLWKLMVSK